ncbi:ankyrin repeat-containing domain protein [Xylariaceae sp. FL0255]|nr:ankyrin repeat-containing domain protein [Xylariaceae sp. FL0255]
MSITDLPNELLAAILGMLVPEHWKMNVQSQQGLIWQHDDYEGQHGWESTNYAWLGMQKLRLTCKRFDDIVSYHALRRHRPDYTFFQAPWKLDNGTSKWLLITRMRSQPSAETGLEGDVRSCIAAMQAWNNIGQIQDNERYLKSICEYFLSSRNPITMLEWFEKKPDSPQRLPLSGTTRFPDTQGQQAIQSLKSSHGLHMASFLGELSLAKTLLEDGADPNDCDQHFGSPLYAAAYSGHTEIVSLLLDHGADLEKEESLGTPIDAATSQGHRDILLLLLRKRTATEPLRNTSLLHSIRNGHVEVVQLLLKSGEIDINSQYPLEHVLDQRIRLRPEEIEESPISVKSKLLLGIFDSVLPIMQAICSGREEALELLLMRKDVDPNVCQGRRSALTAAIKAGNEKMTQLLLARKDINVNLIDPSDSSALKVALERSNEAVTKKLLTWSDIDLQDQIVWGEGTALVVAAKGNSETNALLILHRMKNDGLQIPFGCVQDSECALFAAMKKGHQALVRRLLHDNPVSGHFCAYDLLGLACHWGFIDVVAALWEQGIKPGRIGLSTPLITAIEAKRTEVVRLLLSSPEVDPNQED